MDNQRKWINIGIVTMTTVATLVSIPYVLTCLFYISWTALVSWLSIVVLFFFISVYLYIWISVYIFVSKKRILKWKTQLLLLLPTIAFGCAWGGYAIDSANEVRYEVVSTEVDLSKYQPFKSDLLATLNNPSTLQVEEPLPKLDGATAFFPVYAAFAQAIYPEKNYGEYNEETQEYHDEIDCTTTPWAYENLLNKEKDIIFVFGPSDMQQEMFDDAQEEMVMTAIGAESFVFFVNVDNPIDSLTQQQIRDIYSGKITNWREVGGNDEAIIAYQRPEGSGSQTALLDMMKDVEVMDPLEENVASGMGDIISQTAQYRNRGNAIGYSFRYYAEGMVKNNSIKFIKVDGIAPTKDNIKNQQYPFIFPFYAIHLASNDNDKINPIIQWVTSSQGKELITKSGYVSY